MVVHNKSQSIIVQAYLDFTSALAASGSQVFLKAIFTVKFTFLLNEANVLQGATAIAVNTVEVFGTPDLAQSGNEGTPKWWKEEFSFQLLLEFEKVRLA